MKIFSIFFLLAGVNFGMPMADQDRDSFNLTKKWLEQAKQLKKEMEESVRAIEESNKLTADMVQTNDRLNHMIETYENLFETTFWSE